uniref:G-protein coupled receptors family 1 profile domain-containing protein n=1 Tax=Plectus sambesii TaxID=2011161 RepID=A0A914VRX5_9BILA
MTERANKSALLDPSIICDDACAFDYMQLAETMTDFGNYSWTNATKVLSRRGGGASFNLQRVVQYVIAPMYLALFTVGLVGNLWVIAVVVQIFRTLKSAVTNRHVLVYILSLSIV